MAPSFRRRGFTLVEILIVLGILIALMGLLFPLIGRAREAARRVQCLNNVRALTQAWLAYAADNERRFCSSDPSVGASLHLTPGYFWGWLGKQPDGTPPHPVQDGKLWPYLNDANTYRCPSDQTAPDLKPYSYAINGILAGPIGTPFTFLRLEDIAQPAKTFVFIEQSDPRTQSIPGVFTTPIYPSNVLPLGGWPGQNHRGTKSYTEGTAVSFADGHAIFWEYSDPRTGTLVESTISNLNGNVNISPTGTKTFPGAYNPNSPDVYQLEAWSGGPVPTNVSQ